MSLIKPDAQPDAIDTLNFIKLVEIKPKLRWVDKGRAIWILRLTFSNGFNIEIDDPKIIAEMQLVTSGWLKAEDLGQNHLPRLEEKNAIST